MQVNLPLKAEPTFFTGFLLCLDSLFHEILTMPLGLWGVLEWGVAKAFRGPCHQFRDGRQTGAMIRAGIFLVAVLFLNTQVDMASLYHWLRAQGFLKLYVLFNMTEMLERLMRSLGCDFLEDLMTQPSGTKGFFFGVYVILHCIMHILRILLITSTLNARDSFASMFLLLISNNFGEIKSSVFKRYTPQSIFVLVTSDIVERFYLFVDLLVLVCTLWLGYRHHLSIHTLGMSFTLVIGLEVLTDWVKFWFITRAMDDRAFKYHQEVMLSDFVSGRGPDPPEFAQIMGSSQYPVRRIGLMPLPLVILVYSQVIWPFLWLIHESLVELHREPNYLLPLKPAFIMFLAKYPKLTTLLIAGLILWIVCILKLLVSITLVNQAESRKEEIPRIPRDYLVIRRY